MARPAAAHNRKGEDNDRVRWDGIALVRRIATSSH
jgi:hypothetical protein